MVIFQSKENSGDGRSKMNDEKNNVIEIADYIGEKKAIEYENYLESQKHKESSPCDILFAVTDDGRAILEGPYSIDELEMIIRILKNIPRPA